MRERGDDVVVVDGRPVSEYLKMTIPSSICCPNGELGLRIRELVPDATTPIVVNCAGRTRSIIGAQTLINLGIPNPVMALENGPQGWYLEDLPLEHGSTRRYPDVIAPATVKDMREASQQ
ncbi:rhodanese-like domain-containing protein, partial [Escherichia coli]|nr:rhodanese-like domain-containing protein [Escherichia coli]